MGHRKLLLERLLVSVLKSHKLRSVAKSSSVVKCFPEHIR